MNEANVQHQLRLQRGDHGCVQDTQGIRDVCGAGKNICETDAPCGCSGESGRFQEQLINELLPEEIQNL